MDWHESKAIPGKWLCAWEDDASRLVPAGGEFDNPTTENAIKVVREAKKVTWEVSPRETLTWFFITLTKTTILPCDHKFFA